MILVAQAFLPVPIFAQARMPVPPDHEFLFLARQLHLVGRANRELEKKTIPSS
jgi:hypothetical protein